MIDHLLGCQGHPKPTYVHEVSETIEGIKGEGSQAESDSDEPYTLAAWSCPRRWLTSKRSACTKNECRPRAPTSIQSCSAA